MLLTEASASTPGASVIRWIDASSPDRWRGGTGGAAGAAAGGGEEAVRSFAAASDSPERTPTSTAGHRSLIDRIHRAPTFEAPAPVATDTSAPDPIGASGTGGSPAVAAPPRLAGLSPARRIWGLVAVLAVVVLTVVFLPAWGSSAGGGTPASVGGPASSAPSAVGPSAPMTGLPCPGSALRGGGPFWSPTCSAVGVTPAP
jgi:hypothetical protein